MPYPLAKLDDVKAALGFGGDAHDAELMTLLLAATATAERLVGVASLRRGVDRVEFPRATASHAQVIRLERWPVESVASVQLVAYSRPADDFADAPVVDPATYTVERPFGAVVLFRSWWSANPMANRVVYTAGYADPSVDPDTLPVVAVQAPDDLQRAIVTEAVRLWNTKGDAGVATVDAGKAGRHNVDQGGACEQLVQACGALRRVAL